MKTQKAKLSVGIGLAVLIFSMTLFAEPMNTVFTYQGRLLDGNVPADGIYDFRHFYHYAEPNEFGIVELNTTGPIEDVQVTDGYFIMELPITDGFNGDARWLEIQVRPGESTEPNDFVALEPTVEITPTPYAFYALKTRGIYVDPNEYVGIGTTTPTEQLEVAGTIKADAFVGDGSDLTGIAKVVNVDMHDVPRWSGTYLTGGSIYDDGTHITIGDTPFTYADQLLSVKTNTLPASVYAVMLTEGAIGQRYAVRAYTSGNLVGPSYGVHGSSWSAIGDNYGIYGICTNPSTGDNYGVYGQANNSGGGNAWAGYFDGDGYFSDNLGIGTESPASRLDIGSTSDAANSIRIASSGQASIIFYDAGSSACGGMEYFHTNNSLSFVTQDSGGGSSTKMTIDTDGNVGIGAAYPLSKLQVAGTVHSTTGGFKFPDNTTQTTASNADGHSLDAADGNPIDAVYVNNDGMVGIGNQDPYFKLDVGDISDSYNYLRIRSQDWGGVVFYDGEDLASGGIKYSHSADSLQFETRDYGGSSSTKMIVKAGGYVGIGTVNPTSELEVAGTIEAENIGIGTDSPSHALDVYGDQIRLTENSTGHSMAMRTDGTVLDLAYEGASLVIQGGADNEHVLFNTNSGRDCRVGVRTWTPTRRFFVNGDAGGTTSWYNDSDARLKKDIVTIDNPLEKVNKLRGVQFEWNDPEDHVEGKQIGFIGQETVDVVPEVVDVKNGQYSMQYAPLTALLVEAVKEQQKQIEALQAQISRLNERLENH